LNFNVNFSLATSFFLQGRVESQVDVLFCQLGPDVLTRGSSALTLVFVGRAFWIDDCPLGGGGGGGELEGGGGGGRELEGGDSGELEGGGGRELEGGGSGELEGGGGGGGELEGGGRELEGGCDDVCGGCVGVGFVDEVVGVDDVEAVIVVEDVIWAQSWPAGSLH
jgi:hypothetical protein